MDKLSPTVENYLQTIYLLERDQETVVGARLADLLGVSPPTVTNTLKRMARDELVSMDSAHTPHLTQQGREAAQAILRKHMLAEWMLSEMLSWSQLHHEAHQFEHAISNQVEEALLEKHGYPEVCPHGNPLPGYEAIVSDWILLTEATNGTHGMLRRVHEFAEDQPEILSFLEEKHLEPGQEITVEEILPFNETVTVRVGGERFSLGFAIARYLYLELLPSTD